jgi:hypothetical protein
VKVPGQAGNLKEYRREAVETEGGHPLLFRLQRVKGFSQVRATQAYPQRSVEENEREKPRRARGSADAVGIHEDSWAKGQMPMIRVPGHCVLALVSGSAPFPNVACRRFYRSKLYSRFHGEERSPWWLLISIGHLYNKKLWLPSSKVFICTFYQ